MPDTVDTVIWAADDGWRYHPKHVEQFADINKLYIVVTCWTIIDRNYMDKQILEKQKEVKISVVWRKALFRSMGGVKNIIHLEQRFSNCGPRTTSGPRVLPLWSS